MYCPVDGTEYREGITRCPEHDVDLVDEPLEPEEADEPLLDLIDDRFAIRLAFRVLLAAAAVYALSGVVFSVMLFFPSLRESFDSGTATAFRLLQAVNGGAWAVGMAALGALAGAVLVRTYSLLRGGAMPPAAEEPPASNVMRLLLAILIVSSALWAATGVLTAWENAEYVSGVAFGRPEDPSQTHIALSALHSAAYACAVAAFAGMAGALVKRTYDRMSARGG
ncbi:MAG TPA: hypothetical protein VG318_00835 [Actinomycetota bacterium]|nr:hypothetical protein [Actinomycetota bacterium]